MDWPETDLWAAQGPGPEAPAALTYHLLLHGLQGAGDGRGAAVRHISAQSFLYMAVQFLQPEER